MIAIPKSFFGVRNSAPGWSLLERAQALYTGLDGGAAHRFNREDKKHGRGQTRSVHVGNKMGWVVQKGLSDAKGEWAVTVQSLAQSCKRRASNVNCQRCNLSNIDAFMDVKQQKGFARRALHVVGPRHDDFRTQPRCQPRQAQQAEIPQRSTN